MLKKVLLALFFAFAFVNITFADFRDYPHRHEVIPEGPRWGDYERHGGHYDDEWRGPREFHVVIINRTPRDLHYFFDGKHATIYPGDRAEWYVQGNRHRVHVSFDNGQNEQIDDDIPGGVYFFRFDNFGRLHLIRR